MTPGDGHCCLQPVGQHEPNTFPHQTENFPEQVAGQSTHAVAVQKKEKEGESECTQAPVEGNGDEAEATVSSPVLQRKAVLKALGWQDVG